MTPNEIAVAKAKNEALKRPTQSERAKLAKLLLLTAVRGNPDKLVHTHNAKLAVKLADALLEELQ